MLRLLGRSTFYLLCLGLCLKQAHSKTLIIPYPGLIEQEGLLQPSVLLGKPGFTMEGLASTGRIPSRFSIAGAFPMFKQDTLRGSGWMWSVRSGVTDFLYVPNEVFAAGHYYFEAGLGRGTAAPFFEDRSGLRGYMELSLRSERPRFTPRVSEVSKLLGQDVRDKKTFLSLKIGAGSSLDAEGLVLQKPGTWGTRVQTQIYLPITDHGGSVLNATVEGYRQCGAASWLCGWHVSYQHHYQTEQAKNFDELADMAGLGIFVNYYQREDYNLSTRITWPFIGNASSFGFDAAPLAQILLTKSF